MREIAELVDGYRAFYRDDYPAQAALYRSLAEFGQTLRSRIIGCCDSRVDTTCRHLLTARSSAASLNACCG